MYRLRLASVPAMAALAALLLPSLMPAQITFERTYGGPGSDYGCSVQQTADSGYIVTGWTESFGAGGDLYLIKTNVSGDTLWTRAYGETVPKVGYSVQQTADGDHVIAGHTYSFGAGSADVYLVKTNPLGNVGVAEESPKPQVVRVRLGTTVLSGE